MLTIECRAGETPIVTIDRFIQARKLVLKNIQQDSYGVYISGRFFSGKKSPLSVQVTPKALAIFHEPGKDRATIAFRGLHPVTAGKFAGSYFVSDTGKGINPGLIGAKLHIYLRQEKAANELAAAINWLIQESEAKNDEKARADFIHFQKEAAAWRESTVLPPLLEAVQRQRILAEEEVRAKRFDEALEHYEDGLAVSPLWPEGQYNAALLSAEIESFQDAVRHMKCYLELTPNAPDVRQAREKIIIWEEKSK